jgi:hypothetical protein
MKEYINALQGGPGNPPLLFSITGDVRKDTDTMKLINQASAGWTDINKVEMQTLDTPRIIEKVSGKNLWEPDNVLAANTFCVLDDADMMKLERKAKEIGELGKARDNIKKGSKESADIHKKAESGEPLTDKEQKLYDFIHNKLDTLHGELNDARAIRGDKLIPYRQNYIPHLALDSALSDFFKTNERDMSKITNEQKQAIINGDFTKGYMPFNKFAQQRLGNKTKYDIIGNYEQYLDTALREIYYAPAIQHARKFIDYALVNQPNASIAMHRWLNEMKGKKSIGDENIFGAIFSWRPIQALNNLFGKSALFGNLNFWTINASNFTTSLGELGPYYFQKGIVKFYGDKTLRDKAFANSHLLKERTIDPDIDPSKLKTVEATLNFINTLIEYNNVGVSWVGGYLKGIEKFKYSEPVALRYADAVARRSQVGYKKHELNAWMRSSAGRVLGKFQNWAFNAANYLLYDLGLKNIPGNVFSKFTKQPPRKVRWGAWWAIFGMAIIVNAAYRKLGLRQPYGMGSFIPSIPFITQGRYQQPPVSQFITNVERGVGIPERPGTNVSPEAMTKARRRAILSFIPAGTQIGRFMEGKILPINQSGQPTQQPVYFRPSFKSGRYNYQKSFKRYTYR